MRTEIYDAFICFHAIAPHHACIYMHAPWKVTLAGSPGGYGSYVLRLLGGHNIVSVQHNGGAYVRAAPQLPSEARVL